MSSNSLDETSKVVERVRIGNPPFLSFFTPMRVLLGCSQATDLWISTPSFSLFSSLSCVSLVIPFGLWADGRIDISRPITCDDRGVTVSHKNDTHNFFLLSMRIVLSPADLCDR
jgi:hypothetical protein